MADVTLTLNKKSFEALASDTRIKILKLLRSKSMTVTELSDVLNTSKSNTAQHLRKLVDADLIRKRNVGRKWVYYELTETGIAILEKKQVRARILLSLIIACAVGGIVEASWAIYRIINRPELDINYPAENYFSVLYLYLAVGIILILISGLTLPAWKIKYKLFL